MNCCEALHNIGDKPAPFLLAVLFQSPDADIILEGSLFIRQMTQFHRLDHTIDNHCGSETRSKTEEQHLPAPIAPERLHCCIVHDPYGALEGCFEIETRPSFS